MVDQLLGGLFGAKDDDDEPTRRGRARDYVDRYDARDDSPEEVARAMQQADQEPGGGGLAGLFGLGGSNASSGQSQGQSQGGGIGGMLDNPVAKVAMAGVAAMVAKKLTEPNR